MKIARVFPRKTNATPIDNLSFFTEPMIGGVMPEFAEVHISVTFTYDMKNAEWLYRQWESVGVPVKIGGPAFSEKSGDFTPGLYLKEGNIITSRGCPNHCWFCSVPQREGGLRELEIKEGWNLRDDNILACSDQHIKKVFEMLKRQPHRAIFSGGLEAKLLKQWHVDAIADLKPERMYFAYDTPDDYEPLVEAGKLLNSVGITIKTRKASCYVLIGYKGDTFEKAEKRLIETIKAGFVPYAMLYKNENGDEDLTWRRFQREWCRPIIVGAKIKELVKE